MPDVRAVYDDLVELHADGVVDTPMGRWVRATDERWSAVLHSLHPVFEVDRYPTIELKAARLLVGGCVTSHPLIDGNKRLAVFAMFDQLLLNGYTIDATDDEIIDIVHSSILAKRDGASVEFITETIAAWLAERIAPLGPA
jgi:death-on-curing protein